VYEGESVPEDDGLWRAGSRRGLYYLFCDTWLLIASGGMATLRTPVQVVMGLFQPPCYMLLFAPLLDGDFGDPSVVYGFGIVGALTLLALGWAARTFRRATA